MAAIYYENFNYKLKIACGVNVLLALRFLFEIVVYGEDKVEDDKQGFWGEKTANTNWCESDYVVTHYIAEFGNTISSLFVIFFGIYGIKQNGNIPPKIKRFCATPLLREQIKHYGT